MISSAEEIQNNYQLQYQRETIYAKLKDNVYEAFTLNTEWNHSYNYSFLPNSNSRSTWNFKGFTVTPQNRIITIKDNNISVEEKEVSNSKHYSKHYSASQINDMNFYSIGINMKNVEKELQP